MKNLNDLTEELSSLFGPLVSNMQPADINILLVFILSGFSYDFPMVNASVQQFDTTAINKIIYLESLSSDFLEVQYVFPIKKLVVFNSYFRDIINNSVRFDSLNELFSIQLTSQYVNNMSSYYVPQKPPILTDSTGEFINLTKDSVILYLTERILDPANIPEYVYSVLRIYTFQKFIDIVINRQLGDAIEANKKVFDLLYTGAETDMSNGDMESISSVSLSGLSVSFGNKLTQYATALSSANSGFGNNSSFLQEMNNHKKEYRNKFKRKKNIFYNYLY